MPTRVVFGLLLLIALAMLGAAALTGEGAVVAAAALIPIVVGAFIAFNAFVARNKRDTRDPAADRGDTVPAAHLSPDPTADDRPMGDTPEAHEEVSPHDLPRAHPGRAAAERQSEGQFGTTSGNPEGGAADTEERVARTPRGSRD